MSTPTSQEITRKSRSNLAFALACLPKQKREDMTTFYAFCRVIDDIADDPSQPVDAKKRDLKNWDDFVSGVRPAETELERELEGIFARYPIDRPIVREIIRGMEMDTGIRRYATYADLEKYCYRVASAVGLVSIEIFGYQSPATKEYAVELGHAFQLTNILRDVAEDLREDDRLYLPQEDLARFHVTEENLRAGIQDDNFRALMAFEADRAETRYRNARRFLAPEDRGNLKASELMRAIYRAILEKMRRGGFRVLEQRYRLSGWEKAILLAKSLLP